MGFSLKSIGKAVGGAVKTAVTGGNVWKGTPFQRMSAKLGAAGRTGITKAADAYTGGAFSKAGGFDTLTKAGKAAYGEGSFADVAKSAGRNLASDAVKGYGGGDLLKSAGDLYGESKRLGVLSLADQGKPDSALTTPKDSVANRAGRAPWKIAAARKVSRLSLGGDGGDKGSIRSAPTTGDGGGIIETILKLLGL